MPPSRVRSFGTVIFVLVIVGLSANAFRLAAQRWGTVPPRSKASPPVVPLTVRLKAVMTTGQKTEVLWVETYAVRGDGAVLRRDEGSQAGGAFSKREFFLPDGSRVLVNDIAETRSTFESPVETRRFRAPGDKCRSSEVRANGVETVVGESEIGGHKVFKIKLSTSESYFAPGLGCVLLYAVGNHVAAGQMIKEPVLIVAGEPDSVLFAIPERYREVPSTQLFGR